MEVSDQLHALYTPPPVKSPQYAEKKLRLDILEKT
jgi:hypothetical protein